MTRPQGAAERFVARLPGDLRARLTVVNSPLVAIVPVATRLDIGDARGLIFTSANSVRIAAGLTPRRDLPCFCVGQATTLAAEQAGWQATCVGAQAEMLISTLHQARPDGPLLHLRGTHSRGDVAARLTGLGCLTRQQVIYDQPLLPPSGAARNILAGPAPVIVPLFSPRIARQFAKMCTGPAPLYLAALSKAVAEPIKALNYRGLTIASDPTADAMVRCVEQVINDAARVEGARPAQ